MFSKISVLVFLIFLVSACSHKEKALHNEEASKKISLYIEEYAASYQSSTPENRAYLVRYKEYLNSVYGLLEDNEVEKDFDLYLGSLRNISQIVADAEFNLPQRYTKQTKRRPHPKSSDYLLYKTRIITELYDRLNQERVTKLQNHFDKEVFSKLIENNEKFNKSAESEEPKSLYPL